ncbi:FAD-binding oxidoreductase [Leptospira sp. GIMC2001]|uniref:FAD-binding oxidoreductase n=1 Tax=Leptospira sp. GIMC2001 TaxID=1513297 RepID=UPI002349C542|nr:FAD-binding oxidoreductase [Leptospira sp. GIMC2001]WCL48137.1 FAD-binding oxidoreductase [Leptospira sp. GIMC2001]
MKIYSEFNPDLDYDREKLRWNAWGSVDEDFHGADHMPGILEFLRQELEVGRDVFIPPVPLDEIKITPSKITANEKKSLQQIVGEDHYFDNRRERVLHSAGRSYYDVLRLNLNEIKSFVDCVVYPSNETQVKKILDFATKAKITVIPFGGGSSVVGGLEVLKGKGQNRVLSLDITKMADLISIQTENQTASFQAGIYGPKLEKILNEKGFTLGHFPQSFVYSTLGGWVAARSAGQQSNRYGKIEEMIVGLKLITPAGEIKTGDYPASSSGPDWNHIIAGSEGLLGIITEVTVRIHPLPEKRFYCGFLFPDFVTGKEFIREINQQGIPTSMLRLSDEEESRLLGTLGSIGKKGLVHSVKAWIQQKVLSLYGLDKTKSALIMGIEGNDREIQSHFIKIREIASQFKAMYVGESLGKNWIKNRFNMPFLRNHIMEFGFGVDTMETSAPYDRLEKIRQEFYTNVKKTIPNSIPICHISHSYHDGACLYFTVLFKMDTKKSVAQWLKLKKTASDTFLSNGASASHHHGIGADHKFWYEKEMGKVAVSSLKGLKSSLDKNGILNPKKVFD